MMYDVDAHGHEGGASHAAHGPEAATPERSRDLEAEADMDADLNADAASAGSGAHSEIEKNPASTVQSHVHAHGQGSGHDHEHSHGHEHGGIDESALAQIVGIFILEFGILLHSVLIGLTLAVDPDFKVLFVVIVLHRQSLSPSLSSLLLLNLN